jgi:hypothetical protein
MAAEKEVEKAAAMDELRLIKEAEKSAMVATLAVEMSGLEEIVADVTGAAVAAETALQARISSLRQQLGGTNWLTVRGNMASAQSEIKTLKVQSDAACAKQKELNQLLGVGPRLRAKGDELRTQLSSGEALQAAMLQDELAAPPPKKAADVGLHQHHVEKLISHMEQELFAGSPLNLRPLLPTLTLALTLALALALTPTLALTLA